MIVMTERKVRDFFPPRCKRSLDFSVREQCHWCGQARLGSRSIRSNGTFRQRGEIGCHCLGIDTY